MFDFYDRHKLICLTALFLLLVCGATLLEGNMRAAAVTGFASLCLLAYLFRLYKQE